MTVYDRTTLKTFFETGDIPTGTDYANFIDSCLNMADTSAQVILSNFQSPKIIATRVCATDMHVTGTFSADNLITGGVTFVSGNVNAPNGGQFGGILSAQIINAVTISANSLSVNSLLVSGNPVVITTNTSSTIGGIAIFSGTSGDTIVDSALPLLVSAVTIGADTSARQFKFRYTAKDVILFNQASTSGHAYGSTISIARTANYLGAPSPATWVNNGLNVTTTVASGADGNEWAITGAVRSNGAGQNTGVYGQAWRQSGTGPVWGGVSEAADYTVTDNAGYLTGLEVDCFANGTNTVNQNRRGIWIISGTPFGGVSSAASQCWYGIQMGADPALGYYKHGLFVGNNDPVSAVSLTCDIGVKIIANGTYGIWDAGSKSTALLLNGTYASAAVIIDQTTGNHLPAAVQNGAVVQLAAADGVAAFFQTDSFANSGNLTFRRANNTAAAVSALVSGDSIGVIGARGYGATGYSSTARAQITIKTTQDWTDTAQGTRIAFSVTSAGSITNAESFSIGSLGISTTGVVSAASLNVTGDVSASTGKVIGSSASFANMLSANNVNISGVLSANNINVGGSLLLGSAIVSAGGLNVTGDILAATGRVTASAANFSGTVSANALNITTTVTAASIHLTGAVSAVGDINTAANLVAGARTAVISGDSGNFTGAAGSFSGIVSAASLNVTGDAKVATGRLTASAATITSLLTGNTASFSGIVSGASLNLTGDMAAATGRVIASAMTVTSLLTGNTASFSGLVSGNNMNISGTLSANNITVTGSLGLGTAVVSAGGFNATASTSAGLVINNTTGNHLPGEVTAGGCVIHMAAADASTALIQTDAFGATSSIIFRRADGTAASPVKVSADDLLGTIGGRGYGATGYAAANRAIIKLVAAEDWTDTAQGAYFAFSTTSAGTTTTAETVRFNPTGANFVGVVSAGSLNVTGDVSAATGKVVASAASFANMVSAANLNLTGDLTATAGRITCSAATITSLLTGSTASFSGMVSANALNIATAVTAASIHLTGVVSAAGDINTAANLIAGARAAVVSGDSGNFTGAAASFSGIVSAASVNLTGDMKAATGRMTASAATITSLLTGNTASFSGIVSGVSLSLTGDVSAATGTVYASAVRSTNGLYGATPVIISAAGTTQGTAAVLTGYINRGQGVTDGATTGFAIPANQAGWIQYLNYENAVSANLWPPSGGKINALATNGVYILNPQTMYQIIHIAASSYAVGSFFSIG